MQSLAFSLSSTLLGTLGLISADVSAADLKSAVAGWEQQNGVYIAKSVQQDISHDFESGKTSFMMKNPAVSSNQIASATAPVVAEYLDAVNKNARHEGFESLLSEEILGKSVASAYPEPKARGKIIIESPPPPIVVYIDDERMRAGNTFLVAAGDRSVRVDKPPAAPCRRQVHVAEQEVTRVQCDEK